MVVCIVRAKSEEAAYARDHTEVAVTLTNMGVVLQQQGKLAEATAKPRGRGRGSAPRPSTAGPAAAVATTCFTAH